MAARDEPRKNSSVGLETPVKKQKTGTRHKVDRVLINKGWPTKSLNVEYKGAGPLYAHTNRAISKKYNINSAREIFDGAFGARVRAALSVRVSVGQKNYVVLSIKHLINVEGSYGTDGRSRYARKPPSSLVGSSQLKRPDP